MTVEELWDQFVRVPGHRIHRPTVKPPMIFLTDFFSVNLTGRRRHMEWQDQCLLNYFKEKLEAEGYLTKKDSSAYADGYVTNEIYKRLVKEAHQNV